MTAETGDEKHPMMAKVASNVILIAIGRIVLGCALPFAIFLASQIFSVNEKLAVVNTKLHYMDRDISEIKSKLDGAKP